MIKGFDTETQPLTAREMEAMPLIAYGIRNRVGQKMAITGSGIIKAMKLGGFNLNGARLRKIINFIRITNKVPRLCATSKGYFVAKDDQELNDYIAGLTARIEAQQAILDVLKKEQN